MRRQAQAAQLFDDQRLGVRQLETDLRPPMKAATDLDEPGLEGLRVGEEAGWVAWHRPNLTRGTFAPLGLERVRQGSQHAGERGAETHEARPALWAPPSGAMRSIVRLTADGFEADEGCSEGGGIHVGVSKLVGVPASRERGPESNTWSTAINITSL